MWGGDGLVRKGMVAQTAKAEQHEQRALDKT
jgi:hypothetical protein